MAQWNGVAMMGKQHQALTGPRTLQAPLGVEPGGESNGSNSPGLRETTGTRRLHQRSSSLL